MIYYFFIVILFRYSTISRISFRSKFQQYDLYVTHKYKIYVYNILYTYLINMYVSIYLMYKDIISTKSRKIMKLRYPD